MTAITLDLNGVRIADEVEPRQSLADFLRERCGLTATHLGCEHGACGACTVVVDGKATRSCLSLAVMCDSRAVFTLEGLRNDAIMDVLRRQFHECHALQCGFCTPGMLITARDILQRIPEPDAATVRHELSGQICRCTGYANIVKAIVAAGKDLAAAQAHALAGALAEAEALIKAEAQTRGEALAAKQAEPGPSAAPAVGPNPEQI
jgi:aerobic carbon-monoxide dehydrogenase small subunit